MVYVVNGIRWNLFLIVGYKCLLDIGGLNNILKFWKYMSRFKELMRCFIFKMFIINVVFCVSFDFKRNL